MTKCCIMCILSFAEVDPFVTESCILTASDFCCIMCILSFAESFSCKFFYYICNDSLWPYVPLFCILEELYVLWKSHQLYLIIQNNPGVCFLRLHFHFGITKIYDVNYFCFHHSFRNVLFLLSLLLFSASFMNLSNPKLGGWDGRLQLKVEVL